MVLRGGGVLTAMTVLFNSSFDPMYPSWAFNDGTFFIDTCFQSQAFNVFAQQDMLLQLLVLTQGNLSIIHWRFT